MSSAVNGVPSWKLASRRSETRLKLSIQLTGRKQKYPVLPMKRRNLNLMIRKAVLSRKHWIDSGWDPGRIHLSGVYGAYPLRYRMRRETMDYLPGRRILQGMYNLSLKEHHRKKLMGIMLLMPYLYRLSNHADSYFGYGG